MILILLGPPGAGKGTQAKRIQARYNLAHVSTGDLFRAAMQEENELGRQVKTYIEAGQLVPDEVTSAVVEERIRRPDVANRFMLDGYPRTLGQARDLDAFLQQRRLHLDAVLYFDVSEQTAVDRLGGRLLCDACGANYHVRHMPPRNPERCDRCGGRLRQRADDRPETIRERLRVYVAQTRALVDEYDRRGLLRRIDANRGPDEVASDAASVLDAILPAVAGSTGKRP